MFTLYRRSIQFITLVILIQWSILLAVELRLDDTVITDSNALDLPIFISDVTGLGVFSINIEINFNQEVIQLQSVSTTTSISSSWPNPIVNILGPSAQILLVGAQPLVGSGELIIMHFEIVGEPGDVSSLEFGSILLNEGEPEVSGFGCTVSVNMSPTPFNLLTPTDVSVITQLPLVLSWQFSEDTSDDQIYYTILISDNLSKLEEDTLTTTSETSTSITQLKTNATYHWKVVAIDKFGTTTSSLSTFSFNTTTLNTISDPNFNYINKPTLFQNFPNPFNPSTTINYSLPIESDVTISVYDILGIKVNQLISSKQPSGNHLIEWNGTDIYDNRISAGIYFYQLQAGDFIQTRKMVIMK